MSWKNTENSWGLISILIHWMSAVVIIALFGLGLWMVELTYYDNWYTKAPNIHKSIGILLFLLTLFRLIWRTLNKKPLSLSNHTDVEKRLATLVHWVLYILLFLIMFSGYLISTADGRAIAVFAWFEIPAVIYGYEKQEDIAGVVHFYLACTLIGFALLHALGAIKHHFIDKDITLTRMFKSYGDGS